jgi:hypothetical protein
MRIIGKIAIVLVLVYAVLMGGLLAVMRGPILFGRVMSHVPGPAFMAIPFKRLWFIARAGSLEVGDPAPGFDLPTSDKKSRVQLASFHGKKPVVLIFGSYT